VSLATLPYIHPKQSSRPPKPAVVADRYGFEVDPALAKKLRNKIARSAKGLCQALEIGGFDGLTAPDCRKPMTQRIAAGSGFASRGARSAAFPTIESSIKRQRDKDTEAYPAKCETEQIAIPDRKPLPLRSDIQQPRSH
jgi:hypothetical protein